MKKVYVVIKDGEVQSPACVSLRAACAMAGFGYSYVCSKMVNAEVYRRKGTEVWALPVKRIDGRGRFK